jgi:catechol 2,3-dioxygenase-like lactoylglutathione lyase family enzyme
MRRPAPADATTPADPAYRGPWNLGVKVKDLGAELAFLEACGATQLQQGTMPSEDGGRPFGMAFLGPQRLLLFPQVIYEDALAEPLKLGLAHAVYEVDDLDAVIARLARGGVRPFWGPTDITTAFDKRRIAFFRSPSGFIFEAFHFRP